MWEVRFRYGVKSHNFSHTLILGQVRGKIKQWCHGSHQWHEQLFRWAGAYLTANFSLGGINGEGNAVGNRKRARHPTLGRWLAPRTIVPRIATSVVGRYVYRNPGVLGIPLRERPTGPKQDSWTSLRSWAGIASRRTRSCLERPRTPPGLPARTGNSYLGPVGQHPAVLCADGPRGVAVRGDGQDHGDGGAGVRFNGNPLVYVAGFIHPLRLLHLPSFHRERMVPQRQVAQLELLA